jgi:hypothetical protein
MDKLTKEQRDFYLRHLGNLCPCCHSSNVSYAQLEADGNYAWSYEECLDCGAEWKDIYQLVDVEDMEQ